MPDKNLDDYRWLVSDRAEPLLVRTLNDFEENRDALAIAKSLRKEITATRTALVMELSQLRIRAKRKFENANELFFTRRGLEQSTSQQIAKFKARRFSACKQPVFDVCCGIGGDLMQLAVHLAGHADCIGVDSDPLICLLAMRNLEVLGVPTPMVIQSEFEQQSFPGRSMIHIDPDRRVKRRTVRAELFEPSLPEIVQRFAKEQCTDLAIKVAPATPWHEAMTEDVERHWLGDRREAKQQVLWFGSLAKNPGGKTATKIDKDGTVSQFHSRSDRQGRVATAKSIRRYVFEPHPTILAAGLTDELAEENGIYRISNNVDYLTGDRRPRPAQKLLTIFKVFAVLPFNIRQVQEELRKMNVGRVEVKKRGVETESMAQFSRMRLEGDESAVVILTRLGDQRRAIIAKRVRHVVNDDDDQSVSE